MLKCPPQQPHRDGHVVPGIGWDRCINGEAQHNPPVAGSEDAALGRESRSRSGRPGARRNVGEEEEADCSPSPSRSSSSSSSSHQEIRHFEWEPGVVLNMKYKLTKLLGDGTFGRVLLAQDLAFGGRDVAIKVIRDVPRYAQEAKYEAAILAEIRKADWSSTTGCVAMFDSFMHEEKFFCIVFEPLGVSLYDFLKSNEYRGFWMQDIQQYAYQSMHALLFLHGQLKITHTDLKPENILLQSMEPPHATSFPREDIWKRRPRSPKSPAPYMRPANAQIKLIDFGGATHEIDHHSTIINTRQYRGPEVTMEQGWDHSSDIWSIGCILMELYLGDQLFETHEELEHLALIDRIVGPFPTSMLERASNGTKDDFMVQDSGTGHWRLAWPDRSSSAESEQHVFSQQPLAEQVLPAHREFANFAAALVQPEPKKRMQSINAVLHPFFRAKFTD